MTTEDALTIRRIAFETIRSLRPRLKMSPDDIDRAKAAVLSAVREAEERGEFSEVVYDRIDVRPNEDDPHRVDIVMPLPDLLDVLPGAPVLDLDD